MYLETCTSVGIPANGKVVPQSCVTDQLLPAGTICTFICHDGYSLVGSPSIQCDVDGMFVKLHIFYTALITNLWLKLEVLIFLSKYISKKLHYIVAINLELFQN